MTATIDAATRAPDLGGARGRLKRSWLPEAVTQYGLWILALTFVIGPIIPVLWASLWSTPLYESGGSLTLRNFQDLRRRSRLVAGGAQQRVLRQSSPRSARSVLGCSLAILFVRTNLPGRRLLRGFILLPVMLPGLALILGWTSMYSPSGYVTLAGSTPVRRCRCGGTSTACRACRCWPSAWRPPVVYLSVDASLTSHRHVAGDGGVVVGRRPGARAAHGDAAAAAAGDPQLRRCSCSRCRSRCSACP